MIKRRKTRTVHIGPLRMGSGHPIIIQSMTNVLTHDQGRCIRQIRRLIKAGCGLVRVAVPTARDSEAFARIVSKTGLPLVADIHFEKQRAIDAIEGGAAKIRLNPGNIKKIQDIHAIIDAAWQHGTAIRVGVNEASIRDLGRGDIPEAGRVRHMLAEMKKYVQIFEKRGFEQIVLSAKSADTLRTIEINRLLAAHFEYPIHLGLTHAGLPEDAAVPSAIAIGTLLSEGIGDTIRVSLACDPVEEVKLGQKILAGLGLMELKRPELVVCPTCGRCEINLPRLARQVKAAIDKIDKPLRVAVMGCVVNGPGEAADADVAVCAGKGKGFIYAHGKRKAVVSEDNIIQALLEEIAQL